LPTAERHEPGYLLRQAREAAGLTQAQLAARLGCSQQAVSQAERWGSNPTFELVAAWADATGHRFEPRLVPAT
jgi:transcriptional regulator with XRE-family HTH domain